jgi:anti-sigma B factor antagonist
MLNIVKNTENAKLTVALEGRLDTTTAPELEQSLKESMDSANDLTLDFSKLDYISSAGLRVLLSAHKSMAKKGGMKVVNVNDVVNEVFDVTGFADILNIE